MSYEDDGDHGDGGGGGGKLVPVGFYLNAHDAELARTALDAHGLLAFVWDASTVGVDPMLAVAVRGVKVVVRARDAGRARAILEPIAEVFGGKLRPAFRVKGSRGLRGMVIGGAAGLVVGAGLAHAFGGPLTLLLGVVLGGVGRWWGERTRADSCSSCLYPISAPPADADTVDRCDHCGHVLCATIAHVNDRLAAEEALGLDADDEASDDDGDLDSDDDAPDDDGDEVDDATAAADADHDDHDDDARKGPAR